MHLRGSTPGYKAEADRNRIKTGDHDARRNLRQMRRKSDAETGTPSQVRQHRLKNAQSLLVSGEYETQKQIFSDDMAPLANTLTATSREKLETEQ